MIRLNVNACAHDARVYAIDENTGDAQIWFSRRIGPIPGYPFPLCVPGQTHTVGSVTRHANRLRALSSPTLVGGEYTCMYTLKRLPTICVCLPGCLDMPIGLPTVLQSYDGIVIGDIVDALATVRSDVRNDIIADDFIYGYLQCALWSSTMLPEDSEVSDKSYERHGCEVTDVSLETAIGAKRDCDGFRRLNEDDIDETEETEEKNGIDFWLSRNGHGAGFFDRCDALGTRLQDSARVFSEVNLYHTGNDDDIVIYSDADVDTIGEFDLSSVWAV